jgi:hypothetical protein
MKSSRIVLFNSAFRIHHSAFDAMPQRLAGVMALLAFAVCLIVGGVQAGNPFATTVTRALAAMAGTFVIGLIIGFMGQKMIDENLKAAKEKLSDSGTKTEPSDR